MSSRTRARLDTLAEALVLACIASAAAAALYLPGLFHALAH